jgi:hypothetical protein
MEEVKILFDKLEWHEDEPIPEPSHPNTQEDAYLCLIDWQHFNPALTGMVSRLEVCYPWADSWMSHDDLGLRGPVKCVRAWARI